LQASTSEVYGDPEIHPQHEGYWGRVNPVGLRSCYDEGKRCAETLFFDYHRQHSLDIRVVRIFNTYGPNMHPNDGRVVSNFIVQALSDRDITVYGDGSQTRSFQYVNDLVEGMVSMMENKQGFVGPVNLGNPVEFTILQLDKEVLRLIPKCRSEIIFKPLPSDDPRQRQPDIGLAKQELNWVPSTQLREGLVRTIEYFNSIPINSVEEKRA
jgi:UDP-glucuronate decarboxylase